jgi:hypothetical protein
VGTYVGVTGHACGPDTLSNRCLIQVTNLHASTGNSYQTGWLDEGDPYYTDNTIPRLTDIPDSGAEGGFEQLLWIKTFGGDAARGNGFHLDFAVDRAVTVYVGYDQRYVPPSWIRNNYTEVSASIGVEEGLQCGQCAAEGQLRHRHRQRGDAHVPGPAALSVGGGETGGAEEVTP